MEGAVEDPGLLEILIPDAPWRPSTPRSSATRPCSLVSPPATANRDGTARATPYLMGFREWTTQLEEGRKRHSPTDQRPAANASLSSALVRAHPQEHTLLRAGD